MKMLLLLIAILASSFASAGSNQGEKENLVTSDEYAVYSALLNRIDVSPNDGKEVKLVVIDDQTREPDCPSLEDIAKWDKRLKVNDLKPLLENLLARSKSAKSLARQFTIKHQYKLLNRQTYSTMFKDEDIDGWGGEFYKKYPDSSGFIAFSRVGFNSDATKALVYRRIGCGFLCASGTYFVMSKNNGAWEVIATYNCWIS